MTDNSEQTRAQLTPRGVVLKKRYGETQLY